MRNADRGDASRLDGRELRIGVVQARFNVELTDAVAHACRAELVALGVSPADITTSRFPARPRSAPPSTRSPTPTTTTRWSRSAASSAARRITSSWSPTKARRR